MKEKHRKPGDTPCMEGVGGQPETAEEVIDKYGTYEIQPTADTDNPYPAIAQGRPDLPRENYEKKGPRNPKK